MMTVIGFFLVAVVGVLFIVLAITPMIAEGRTDSEPRRAVIVSLTPLAESGKAIDQADAA